LEFLQGVGAGYKKGSGGRTIAHGAGEPMPFNVQTKGVDKKLHSNQKTKKKR